MALLDTAPDRVRRLAGALGVRRRGHRDSRTAVSPRDAWRIDQLPRRPAAHFFLLNLLLAVTVALVFGIGTAYLAVDRGRLFDEVSLGSWTAYPTAGTPDADPYSAATLARTGQVPLGKGEGIAFFAERASDGGRITAACDFRMSGQTPPGRLWTLTAIDSHGHLTRTVSGRVALDSRDVLRRPSGDFDVAISRNARPGNWLPIGTGVDGSEGPLTLVLRVYDTPLTAGAGIAAIAMPVIVREGCR